MMFARKSRASARASKSLVDWARTRADVLRPPPPTGLARTSGCDLVLLDPPYNQGLAAPALTALAAAGWLAPGALCCVELMAKEPFEPPAGFTALDSRKYGKARIEFLRWAS